METPRSEVLIRRAIAAESREAAQVFVAARQAAFPAIPQSVHPEAEVLDWFENEVMPSMDVWVACLGPTIVAVMVLSEGWIEHLFIDREHTNRGTGSALVARAKAEATGSLDLWTFVSNVGAQRFYERHGFVEVQRTDGDNEEGEPDIRYRWSST